MKNLTTAAYISAYLYRYLASLSDPYCGYKAIFTLCQRIMLFLDQEILPSKRWNLKKAMQISSVPFLGNDILLLNIYFWNMFF